jgi:hypothetical protein
VEYANTAEANYEEESEHGRFAEPTPATDISRAKIEEIVAPLRVMTKGRRRAIFDAANQLAKSGLSSIQIESELIAAVGQRSHLRRNVTESIKSLKRYRRLC